MNYIERFCRDCLARGLAKHTVETYAGQVKIFLQTNSEPGATKFKDLIGFLGLLRSRQLRGSTLKGYYAAINAFYDFLIFEKILENNPIPPFRKRYLSRLEDGETRQLISVDDLRLLVSASRDVQQLAIIMVLAKTGMRLGELLSLHYKDIDIKKGTIRIPWHAKRSNCIAFMDEELRQVIQEYSAWRSNLPGPWLWPTSSGARIRKEYPGVILADLGTPLGLHTKEGPLENKLTPHCMRHFFTTYLHRAGMDPEHIKFLRGDSLRKEAWQRYNHLDIDVVRHEYLRRIPQLLSFNKKISYFTGGDE